MPAPVSVPRPSRSRRLSLALADDVRACMAAFDPAFLDLLTLPHTTYPSPVSHRWPWEVRTASDRSVQCPSVRARAPERILCASESAVETRYNTIIYEPHEVQHRQAPQDMDCVVILAALRVGLNSSAHIKRASRMSPAPGKGKEVLTYVSKMWPRDQVDAWVGFCSELSLYKGARYLRPLQGVVVPRFMGVYATDGGFTLNMEAPHPAFWFEASAAMPDVLKAKVVSAYSELHSRGILHGDVALRHILIGGDARVTIIDFQESRALVGDDAVGLGTATEAELAVEMRRVRYVLDFEGARTYETSKTRREAERRRRKKELARARERGRVTQDFQPVALSDDDVSTPPIHPEELREWKRSCQCTSQRIVIPGTSEEQLRATVSEFVGTVKQMIDGDISWSLSSQPSASSVSASPSPPSPEHPLPLHCAPPTASVVRAEIPRVSTSGVEPAERCEVAQDIASSDVSINAPSPTAHQASTCRSSSQVVSVDDPHAVYIATTPSVSSPDKRARDVSDDASSDLELSPSKRARQAELCENVNETLRPVRSSARAKPSLSQLR